MIPIQVLLAVISVPSGALLLYSPGGEALGAQTILPQLKQQIPFIQDFVLVGAFLLIVYGILPLLFSYGLWARKRWAWTFTVLLGITEIGWILTEVVLFFNFGFFFYPIIAGMGALTIILCWLPSVRRYCGVGKVEIVRTS